MYNKDRFHVLLVVFRTVIAVFMVPVVLHHHFHLAAVGANLGIFKKAKLDQSIGR
jgi:hypothetical protein